MIEGLELEDYLEQKRCKVRELIKKAKAKKTKIRGIGKDFTITQRQYLVTIIEQHTEFADAMGFLAELTRYFSVKPL